MICVNAKLLCSIYKPPDLAKSPQQIKRFYFLPITAPVSSKSIANSQPDSNSNRTLVKVEGGCIPLVNWQYRIIGFYAVILCRYESQRHIQVDKPFLAKRVS